MVSFLKKKDCDGPLYLKQSRRRNPLVWVPNLNDESEKIIFLFFNWNHILIAIPLKIDGYSEKLSVSFICRIFPLLS